MLEEIVAVIEGKTENVLALLSGNDVLIILGIKVSKVLNRDTDYFTDLAEVEVPMDQEGVHPRWKLGRSRLQPIFLGIIHGVHVSYHQGDIPSGLLREIGVN